MMKFEHIMMNLNTFHGVQLVLGYNGDGRGGGREEE